MVMPISSCNSRSSARRAARRRRRRCGAPCGPGDRAHGERVPRLVRRIGDQARVVRARHPRRHRASAPAMCAHGPARPARQTTARAAAAPPHASAGGHEGVRHHRIARRGSGLPSSQRVARPRATSARAAARAPPSAPGTASGRRARDAAAQHVGADVEEQQQPRQQEERDDQQRRHEADEDVGERSACGGRATAAAA